MVSYEFDMIERFFENSIYLDIPIKFILLGKVQCLVMFSLKYLLKNVQRMDITQSYVEAVITKQSGNVTMQLACKVAFDLYTESSIDYLNSQNAEADICFDKDIDFNQVLKEYVTEKKHLFFKSEEPQEKQTRSIDFTILVKNIFQICGKLSKKEFVTQTSVKPPLPSQRHQQKVFSVSTVV